MHIPDVPVCANPPRGRALQISIPSDQERTISEPSRFSLLHLGKGRMIDHLLISRTLLMHYRRSDIHNKLLHDESAGFTDDKLFPESDHAPVIAEFALPDS